MIDLIKDLAAIADKHKRKWGFHCDDGQMIIWIADDLHMEEFEKHEIPEQCMKIVYCSWDFGEAYFEYKNIIKTYTNEAQNDGYNEFAGFSTDEMKVVAAFMEYIKANSEEITDWIETYFPYQFPDDESVGD